MVESLRFKRGFAEEENDYCAAEAVEHPTEYPAPTKEEILYTFLVQYRELLQQTKARHYNEEKIKQLFGLE